MGSAGTKNTLGLLWGNNSETSQKTMRRRRRRLRRRIRTFSITLAEILKVYGQAALGIIINFQEIKA